MLYGGWSIEIENHPPLNMFSVWRNLSDWLTEMQNARIIRRRRWKSIIEPVIRGHRPAEHTWQYLAENHLPKIMVILCSCLHFYFYCCNCAIKKYCKQMQKSKKLVLHTLLPSLRTSYLHTLPSVNLTPLSFFCNLRIRLYYKFWQTIYFLEVDIWG
jgi:hypothetical protein